MRIKCVNLKCTAPGKSFVWDEEGALKRGGRVVAPRSKGAVRLVVTCPHCGAGNALWVSEKKVTRQTLYRG